MFELLNKIIRLDQLYWSFQHLTNFKHVLNCCNIDGVLSDIMYFILIRFFQCRFQVLLLQWSVFLSDVTVLMFCISAHSDIHCLKYLLCRWEGRCWRTLSEVNWCCSNAHRQYNLRQSHWHISTGSAAAWRYADVMWHPLLCYLFHSVFYYICCSSFAFSVFVFFIVE